MSTRSTRIRIDLMLIYFNNKKFFINFGWHLHFFPVNISFSLSAILKNSVSTGACTKEVTYKPGLKAQLILIKWSFCFAASPSNDGYLKTCQPYYDRTKAEICRTIIMWGYSLKRAVKKWPWTGTNKESAVNSSYRKSLLRDQSMCVS